MSRATLVTGVTGFVGGQLVPRLEAAGHDVVRVTRRPLSGIGRELRAELTEVVPRLPRDVTSVIHCAASVRFDLPVDEQRAINVEGTRRLLERAAELPDLERFVHVSTAYVNGDHRNAYEQTKAEAEALVRSFGLPFSIVRPSIVVGDQRTGETTSFNVLYQPLRAFSRGVLDVVPGRATAPVDVVPVDVVADAIVALLDAPAGGVHQVVAGPQATSVGELVALASARFGRPAARIVPPLDRDLDLGGAEALLPYFDVDCCFHDPATAAFLERRGVVVPPLQAYFDTLVGFAEAARWGRAPRAVAA